MTVSVMKVLLIVSASILFISAGPAPPPLPETPLPKEVILALVADLNSSNFHVRRAATRKLKYSGVEAVVPLVESAQQGDLEVTTRAIEILETIYASDDLTASEASEAALEQLAQSRNRSVALRADSVLFEYYYQIREPRVVAKIKEFHGIVAYSSFMVDDPKNPEVMRKQIAHIKLGASWDGGNEGIELLKRLKNLQILYVSQEDGVSLISEKAEQELLKAIPKLVIQYRGRAYLGISGQPNFQGQGIYVTGVKPNTGAARAGMQVRDEILLFAGKPVRDFDELIKLIKQTKPGDKVDVVIHRGTKQMTLRVVMGEWGVEMKPKK
ncbi:MAG: PDZ domain-containing protein [Planctomycetes bacterium]|nr:PDZ domain-containing protein [Planctomycetota bacterium]